MQEVERLLTRKKLRARTMKHQFPALVWKSGQGETQTGLKDLSKQSSGQTLAIWLLLTEGWGGHHDHLAHGLCIMLHPIFSPKAPNQVVQRLRFWQQKVLRLSL
jgi:hypothetical protein